MNHHNRGGSSSRRGYDLPPPPPPPSRHNYQQQKQEDEQQRYYRGGRGRSYSSNDEQQKTMMRDRSCSYDRPPTTTTNRRNSDWKCLECKTWNYPQERSCARCGAPTDDEAAAAAAAVGSGGGGGPATTSRGNDYWNPTQQRNSSGGDDDYYYYRGGDGSGPGGGGGGGGDNYNYDYHQRGDNDYTSREDSDSRRRKEDRIRRRETGSYDEDYYYDHEHPNEAPVEGGGVEEGEEHQEQDMDEFGRFTKPPPAKKKKKERREWPPHFEKNGTAFTFDSRCAMFYEAESDFFYDPKNKLYYGNKQKSYYRYSEDQDPPFEKVVMETTDAAGGVTANTTTNATDLEPVLDSVARPVSADSAASSKKSIAIKLKTKKLKSKKAKSSSDAKAVAAASAPGQAVSGGGRAQKNRHMDIEKWSERQQEMKQDAAGKDNGAASGGSSGDERKVSKTAKGEPICILCRRKFPTMEKLKYHEQVSKLHKENLAKKKKKEEEEEKAAKIKESTNASNKMEYVDRAQQRRNLYGPESSSVLPPLVPTLANTGPPQQAIDAEAAAEPQQQHEPLGKDTVGHKMLQKLGWNAGSALGASRSADRNKEQHQAISKDWDRIETIAASQK